MTRRDKCHLVGKRAARVQGLRCAVAWVALAGEIEALGERDMPKFIDLLTAIRRATIAAQKGRSLWGCVNRKPQIVNP